MLSIEVYGNRLFCFVCSVVAVWGGAVFTAPKKSKRFGIFWKPLEGGLERHVNTIDAALKLHNYIVEYRLAHSDITSSTNEDEQLSMDRHTFCINNPGEINGMVIEEVLLQNALGRRSNEDRQLREDATKIRDDIRDSLWNKGLRRPN